MSHACSARLLRLVMRFCASLLLLAGAFAVFVDPASAAPQQVGSLLSRSGVCSVKRAIAATYAALYEHDPLYAADSVQTGNASRGAVLFDDGSQLLLNSDTTVTINARGATAGRSKPLFHLVTGEVFARLRPGAAAATDSAIAAVRGTVFDLVADSDGASHITVTEGVVDFFNQYGGVQVEAGEHSDALKGQAPTKPVTVAAGSMLFEWTLDLDRSFIPREASRLTTGDLSAALAQSRGQAIAADASAASHSAFADALFDDHRYVEALDQYRLATVDPATDIRIGNTLLALDRVADADSAFTAAGAGPAALVGHAWVALRTNRPADAEALAEQAIAASGGAQLADSQTEIAPGPPIRGASGPSMVGLMQRRTVNGSESQEGRSCVAALRGVDGTRIVVVDDAGQLVDETSNALAYNNSPSLQAAKADLLLSGAATTGAGGRGGQLAELSASAPDVAVTQEARLVSALALMRQTRMDAQATQAFSEVTVEPYASQARSWRALIELRAGDTAAALADARAAVAALPDSSVTHGNLALVCVFADRPGESLSEARKAVAIDPYSASANIALGQADLASGRADDAARAGATAVALDPQLAQSWYLEGLADAARNDLEHARRELQQSARVDPGFVPASAALGRVLIKQGHPSQASDLLSALVAAHPQSADAHAALGLVLYEQGKYAQSVAEYQAASKLGPGSALIHAEFARVLLDDNRLNDAILEAQQAVHLAPDVAQYHALLGLCDSFGLDATFTGEDARAVSEYRDALALDPANSLARFELGLEAYTTPPGKDRIQGVSAVQLDALSGGDSLFVQPANVANSALVLNSIAQSIIYDPAVSDQINQGGVKSEANPSDGAPDQQSIFLSHRDTADNGKVHVYGQYDNGQNMAGGDHTEGRNGDLLAYASMMPGPDTTIVATLISQTATLQFPTVAIPSSGESTSQKSLGQLTSIAARQRFGQGDYIWAGLGGLFTRDDFVYPYASVPTLSARSGNVVPEVRADFALAKDNHRPATLTLGYADSAQHANIDREVVDPPEPTTNDILDPAIDVKTLYGQVAQHLDQRYSYAVLIRRDFVNKYATLANTASSQSIWLPRYLITIKPDKADTLRVIAGRQRTDTTLLTFEPTEAIITTEPDIFPLGDPTDTNLYELDAEHYFGPSRFVKFYGFSTLSDQLIVGLADPTSAFPITRQAGEVSRQGVGIRYEQPLARTLFAKLNFVHAYTSNQQETSQSDLSATQILPIGVMPYQDENRAEAGLDYVDRTGTKAGFRVRYEDAIPESTVTTVIRPHPHQVTDIFSFPSETYVDLRLARETTVAHEYFVQVVNLFNIKTLQFNNLPTGNRELDLGVDIRF